MNNIKIFFSVLFLFSTLSVKACAYRSFHGSATDQYQDFKDEAIKAFLINNPHIQLLNAELHKGMLGLTTKQTDLEHYNIYVDEKAMAEQNFPLGIRRLVVFREMAHVYHKDISHFTRDYGKEQRTDFSYLTHPYMLGLILLEIALTYKHLAPAKIAALVAASYAAIPLAKKISADCQASHYNQALEELAIKTAFGAMGCEQCCQECENYKPQKGISLSSIFVHQFVTYHAGKTCKHHAAQQQPA